MKLRNLFMVITILIGISCKKKAQQDESVNPVQVQISLSKTSYYPLQIGYIELSESFQTQDKEVKLGNMLIPVQQTDENTYSFIVPEETEAGSYELNIKLGSSSQKFTINVLAFPQTLTLSQFLSEQETEFSGYQLKSKGYSNQVTAAMDSIMPQVPKQLPMRISDSISYYKSQILQLPTEVQQTVLKVLYAQMQDFKEVHQKMEELYQIRLSMLSLMKKGSCQSEWEAECLLNEARLIVITLKARLLINCKASVLGGVTAGLITAAITKNSTTSWIVGEKVTIGLLAALSARDIFQAYSDLEVNTLNALVSVVKTWFSNGKSNVQFINGNKGGLPFRVYAKNLAVTDRKLNVFWITQFLRTFDSFRLAWMQTMPNFTDIAPDYLPELKIKQKVKKAEWLSIKDISDNSIKCENMGYENGRAVFTFTSDKTIPVNFSFRVVYDDGLFKTESDPIPSTLNPKSGIYYQSVNFSTDDSTYTIRPLYINGTLIGYIFPQLFILGNSSDIWNRVEINPKCSSEVVMQLVQSSPGGNPTDLVSRVALNEVIGTSSIFGYGVTVAEYLKNGMATAKINGSVGNDMYFGFRIINSTGAPGIYYGWLRMSVSANAGSFTLHEFAISTQPGVPISVGQKE